MDVLAAVLLALAMAVSNAAGFGLAVKTDWSDKARKRFTGLFAAMLFIGVALVTWQAILAHQGAEENKKAQLGDAERPPHIGIVSLPNNTRFVRMNSSNYPAYAVKMSIFENNRQIRAYGPEEMPAHAGTMDDTAWNVNDNLEHRFIVYITTRAGLTSEELVLRPAGNNQWMMACRIDEDFLKCQPPDSYWPRDDKGQPVF